MANAPDTLLVTGQVFQQISADSILMTPTGGTQDTLANLVNGGTVAKAVTASSVVVGSNTIPTIANFASITPSGSTEATATLIPALTTQLGTAASTTGAVLGTGAGTLPIGVPLFVLNSGTAAVHIYGNGYSIDTIAGTTGVTLTNAYSAFFTATGTATVVSGSRGTVSS